MEYIHADFVKKMQKGKGDPIVVDVSATHKHADLVFVIREIENFDPNYDYLGQWVKEAGEWTVNRKRGVLYGERFEKTYEININEDDTLFFDGDEIEEETVEIALWEIAKNEGLDTDDPNLDGTLKIDEDEMKGYLHVVGYETTKLDHHAFVDRGEYEYFRPEYLYGGPNLEIDPQSIEKGIEDWWAMERQVQGYWYLAMLEGTLYFRGYEVGSVTMDWDSDYVWKHKHEIAKTMYDELDIDMKLLDARVHELEDEIAALTNFSPDLLKEGAGK